MSIAFNSELLSDTRVLESFLKNKTILDYGSIASISSDGSKVDVTHQVLDIFNGQVQQIPLTTKGVELLYLNSSSISFDTTPQVGDGVLLLGLRRMINSTKAPMGAPYPPLSPVAYERSTMKAIPLSAIGGQSGLIFRAKGSKLRLRNTSVSLYKCLNDFQSAIATFSSATSQSALSSTTVTGGGYTDGLVSALNNLLSAMNNSISTVANEISNLLED
jgi:hypothetical protein